MNKIIKLNNIEEIAKTFQTWDSKLLWLELVMVILILKVIKN